MCELCNDAQFEIKDLQSRIEELERQIERLEAREVFNSTLLNFNKKLTEKVCEQRDIARQLCRSAVPLPSGLLCKEYPWLHPKYSSVEYKDPIPDDLRIDL